MQINEKLLTKLEKLSLLEIEKDHRKETVDQLTQIVNFVEVLNELDLKDEDATFTTVKGDTPFRKDIPFNNKEIIETILKNAPQSNGSFFVVPAIIE